MVILISFHQILAFCFWRLLLRYTTSFPCLLGSIFSTFVHQNSSQNMQKEGSVPLWSYLLWQHQVFVKLVKSFKFTETKVLQPELLPCEIMAVMEDSGKAPGNACCYIKVQQIIMISQYCVAMVGISDQTSVEDDRNVLAVAGLCLHSIKALSICHAALQARSLGEQEKLGRGTTSTADHRDVPTIPHHAQHMEVIKRKKRGMLGISPRIPKQQLHMVKLSFTESGWISAFPQEAENEFLIFFACAFSFCLT